MKKISIFKRVVAFFLLIIYFFKKKNTGISFDAVKALVNIRPFDTLMAFADEFQKKRSSSGDQVCFDKETIPNYITYNRDAFIALINAPKAEKIRIYFGLGSSDEIQPNNKKLTRSDNLLLCIFPVDAEDNVIRTELVKDNRYPDEDVKLKSVHPLLLVTAAKSSGGGQGVDDGQRQP